MIAGSLPRDDDPIRVGVDGSICKRLALLRNGNFHREWLLSAPRSAAASLMPSPRKPIVWPFVPEL
jgi:hypothetical protein